MIIRYFLCVICGLFVCYILSSQIKYSVRKPVQETQEDSISLTCQGKCYMSFTDYTEGRFQKIEDLTVSARDNAMDSGNYNITTKDKVINKLLESKIRIVEWNNLLFVNCKGLKNGIYRLGILIY